MPNFWKKIQWFSYVKKPCFLGHNLTQKAQNDWLGQQLSKIDGDSQSELKIKNDGWSVFDWFFPTKVLYHSGQNAYSKF